jgi:hypothetical protein
MHYPQFSLSERDLDEADTCLPEKFFGFVSGE